MDPAVAVARSRVAGLISRGAPAADIAAARRDLAAAKLDAYIERTLAEAPPLTPAQLAQLRAHFRRGADGAVAPPLTADQRARPATLLNDAPETAGP